MKIIPESAEALTEALEVLRAGGTVIHATETCYGIACDLTNEDAVKDLFDVKQRPGYQTVSALFASSDAAREYVEVSPKAEELFAKYLPGPLTIVLSKKKNAPPIWLTAEGGGNDGLVGVRISSHPFAMNLAKAFGKPIATTSANLHGKPNPYSVFEIEAQWEGALLVPELIIDAGTLPTTDPSTVIRVVGDTITVLRQGSLHL